VVYHHGVSAALHAGRLPGGATGTGSEREGWVYIDDELVSDVPLVGTFSAPRAEGDSRSAYLLFYRRVQ
jgi:ubiquitin carboxyl-terminal hydrolase 10